MAGNILHKTLRNIFAAAIIFFLISGLSYNLYAQESSDSGFFNGISKYLKREPPCFPWNIASIKALQIILHRQQSAAAGEEWGNILYLSVTRFYYGLGLYFGSGSLSGADFALQTDPRGYPGQFVTPIYYFGLGLEFSYKVNSNIFPYIFLSMSNLFFQPEDIYGNPLPNNAKGSQIYSTRTYEPGIELGGRYFITDKFAINASFTYYFFPNDYLDDLKKGAYQR